MPPAMARPVPPASKISHVSPSSTEPMAPTPLRSSLPEILGLALVGRHRLRQWQVIRDDETGTDAVDVGVGAGYHDVARGARWGPVGGVEFPEIPWTRSREDDAPPRDVDG